MKCFLFLNRYIKCKDIKEGGDSYWKRTICRLYKTIWTFNYYYLSILYKNYFDAEDLAQQTFLAAYQNYERFDGNNFKAWLTTIAANKCKDYLKSKTRTNVSLSEKEYESLKDHGDSPEETVVKRILLREYIDYVIS